MQVDHILLCFAQRHRLFQHRLVTPRISHLERQGVLPRAAQGEHASGFLALLLNGRTFRQRPLVDRLIQLAREPDGPRRDRDRRGCHVRRLAHLHSEPRPDILPHARAQGMRRLCSLIPEPFYPGRVGGLNPLFGQVGFVRRELRRLAIHPLPVWQNEVPLHLHVHPLVRQAGRGLEGVGLARFNHRRPRHIRPWRFHYPELHRRLRHPVGILIVRRGIPGAHPCPQLDPGVLVAAQRQRRALLVPGLPAIR